MELSIPTHARQLRLTAKWARLRDSELIRVTLIDYFSSAILVDSLVYPDVEMSHYNTRFSGVTKKDMEMARAKGTCFRGRDQQGRQCGDSLGRTQWSLAIRHTMTDCEDGFIQLW